MGDIEAKEPLEVAPVAINRRERAKRHCLKRWWIWLIGTSIFCVVFIIIIIFAIIPAVAQKALDKTTLNVQSISILDPAPDRFSLSMVSRITGDGKATGHAELDPMDVSFSMNGDSPFLTVPLPRLTGGGSGGDIVIEKHNYTVIIQNQDKFLQFANTLVSTEEFSVDINGKTKLKEGSLKMNVKYREKVTLKGLNKLQGMEITEYSLVSNETDYNLRGKVLIPNPSIFTIQTGDVPLTISFNGTSLGTGLLPNLILTPGQNIYDFRSLLDTTKLRNALPTFLSGKGYLQIGATGAYFNNMNIPWLSSPLGSMSSNVHVKTS